MIFLVMMMALAVAAGADTLKVDGRERSYVLFQPEGLSGKAPLVLVLHDRDSSPVQMARLTRMHELGAREKFMVAYPEAVGKLWIDGRQKYDREAQMGLQDDVHFLATLVRSLAKTHPVDPSRVYVMGYGNGARMALRLALDHPDLVAGVAAVGGTLAENVDAPLRRPVPLILVNGTVDPLVPESGGPIQTGIELGRVLSSEATLRRFAGAPSGAPSEETRPGLVLRRWPGVLWVRVLEHGHEWPEQLDVPRMIWDFWQKKVS